MKKLSKSGLWIALSGLCLIAIWISSAQTSEIRVLKLPNDVSLGKLWVIENVNCFTCGNGEKFVGEARGHVKIELPAKHWYIKLAVSPGAVRHLDALHNLAPDTIEAVSFVGTELEDAGLFAVSKLMLRELDLSRTSIDGTGFKHLTNRAAWLSIDLRSARNLKPDAFDQLVGQNQISLNLWRSNLDTRPFICDLQERMCAAVKPKQCYVRIRGSEDCAD